MVEKSPYTDAFPKGMSQPAIRALVEAGYTKLEQIAGASAKELLTLHGFGPKSIPIIRAALEDANLESLKP